MAVAWIQANWNPFQAATAARRSPGAPAQARTRGSAAVSDKNLERFRSKRNRSRSAGFMQLLRPGGNDLLKREGHHDLIPLVRCFGFERHVAAIGL